MEVFRPGARQPLVVCYLAIASVFLSRAPSQRVLRCVACAWVFLLVTSMAETFFEATTHARSSIPAGCASTRPRWRPQETATGSMPGPFGRIHVRLLLLEKERDSGNVFQDLRPQRVRKRIPATRVSKRLRHSQHGAQLAVVELLGIREGGPKPSMLGMRQRLAASVASMQERDRRARESGFVRAQPRSTSRDPAFAVSLCAKCPRVLSILR